MAENGRVHPNCVNASNPYHECAIACLEKIAQGKGKKEKKKSGSILETALSFGRKKKGSDSQPNSVRANNNFSAVKEVSPAENLSPRSPFSVNKKMGSDNSQSYASSRQYSDGSYSGDRSLNNGRVRSSESVVTSGIETVPDGPRSPSKVSLACFGIAPPTEEEEEEENEEHQEENEERQAPLIAVSGLIAKNAGEVPDDQAVKSFNFTFSGISRASEDSDEEEVQSVISDSCVSVGKYHVRANIASVLQLIFEKYGDIAANCQLESTSMRAYYLECLCAVVQELQSTPFMQLTKSKIKEMLAVLKDVESAQIDVTWLRGILNELTEAMDLRSTEVAKANCDEAIESTKKELESMMKDLAEKEKAVIDAKAQIDETRSRLKELELESSQLSDAILSMESNVKNFKSKSSSYEIF